MTALVKQIDALLSVFENPLPSTSSSSSSSSSSINNGNKSNNGTPTKQHIKPQTNKNDDECKCIEAVEFEVMKVNKLNSNVIVFGYIRDYIGKYIGSLTSIYDVANLCLGFYCLQVDKLTINDKVDHRDEYGKFCEATIIDKNGNNVKLHYIGYDTKWDIWSDCKSEIDRFTKHKSISQRAAHRFKEYNIGSYIGMNAAFNKHDGWTGATITKLDGNSGQIKVKYSNNNKTYYVWVHLDNDAEVKEYDAKAHGEVIIASSYSNTYTYSNTWSYKKKKKKKKRNYYGDDYEEIPKEWRGGMDLYDC